MNRACALSRREFFELLGGGIVMMVGLDPVMAVAQEARRQYPDDFNAYLVIGENGRVTVFSGKIEMGQGVWTSQAQMLAEELGVELASVDMVLGDTDRCPWDMGTFGSLTTRMFGPALRAAGAQARLTLLSLAAARLGVPQEKLVANKGVVSVTGEPSRKVSYGELSRGARIAQVVDRKAVLRAASEFNVMGSSPLRLDGVAKVTGAAQYAGDIRIPGMLYAQILRPPMHGSKLESVDAAAAESVPGALVVKDGDFVAVLHADPDSAALGLARVKAQWRLPQGGPDTESIFDHIAGFRGADQRIIGERGDVMAARAGAANIFEFTYRKGYVAHAPIETHTALAAVREGKLTVWASTQTPFPTRDLIAQRLKLKPQDVRVITPFVGGGFGGKSASAQAVEAARLAQLTGKPVQVAWTREEEIFYDTFDPAAVVKISSGLDANGRISFWDCAVHASGERGAVAFYDAPNIRTRVAGRSSLGEAAGASLHPFAVGPWRAPGANMNVFAIESQVDIMARATGADPVEFRLRHLSNPRVRKVLQAAADAFGWKAVVRSPGRGYGVACSIDAGTCVATMAEVWVDAATGKIRVVRMVCAQDMGIVVNPIGAKMQIEGGLMMGLGYALREELRFRGGEILDRGFGTYGIARFSDAPRIEAVLVKNDELAPQGGGEPSITTTGAVIANAVADAAGVRMFRLPMTPARVRQATAAKNA
jgi:isoquinoline 1-oxidoreductase